MRRALVFLGELSPAFLVLLDKFSSYQNIDLVFIESAHRKSIIPRNIVTKHLLLKDFDRDLEKAICDFYHNYEQLYCLCVSYGNAQKYRELGVRYQKLTLMVASNHCIDIMKSKQAMSNAAVQSGLPVLDTYYLPEQIDKVQLPAAIRPVSEDQSDFKAALIFNTEELSSFSTKPIIAQPFIIGPNLVVHVAKKEDYFSVEYFIVKDKFEGVALSMERVAEEEFKYLNEKIYLFLEEINFSGVGHFEFIMSDKDYSKLFFLDFNGRLGGTTLKSYALGYDEVSRLLLLNGVELHTEEEKQPFTTVTNYMSLTKQVVKSLRGYKNALDFPCNDGMSNFKHNLSIFFKAKNELSSLPLKVQVYFLWNTIIEKIKV